MKKLSTKGICAYCKNEIPKNSRSILAHYSKCKGRIIHKTYSHTKHMVLLIEDKYNSGYWLVIVAKSILPMKKIDTFIKDIWVECCGHVSSFAKGSLKIGMNQKLNQVFKKENKIEYIYDYGSSTEISISLLHEIGDEDEKDVQIIFRNKDMEFQCSYCDNKAIVICRFCEFDKEKGFLCESCYEKDNCVKFEGREVLLPIINSPRSGKCCYRGYRGKNVEKYFPNDII